MTTLAQLAPNATAHLQMTAGSPCSIAEFGMYLDQYEYVQDRTDQHRWILDNAENRNAPEPCAIVIRDLNGPVEVIDVYGEGSEHFTNLNYLMQRCGWTSCSVQSRSDDINAKMLARFVSVEVSSDFSLPASSLDASQQPVQAAAPAAVAERPPMLVATPPALVPAAAPALAHAHATVLSPDSPTEDGSHEMLVELERTTLRVRELTVQLSSTEQMLSETKDDNETLRVRLAAAQSQAQRTTAVPTSHLAADRDERVSGVATDDVATSAKLMHLIEKYLLPKIDLANASSSELVADLRTAGYDIRLQLVRAS